MEKKEIIQGLHDAILSLDADKSREMASELIKTDIDITEAIQTGMSPAMEEIGKKFQEGEMFLPELALSADVFQAAMDILQPKLDETKKKIKAKGRVLMGTVKGDIHSIGKDLVCTMLKTAGFEVIDIGKDVPTFTFVEEAQKNEVDIIGLSALMTITIPQQREVIEALDSQGLRDKFRVIIGGGAVTQEWANKIGADGYGENAAQAVELAKRLCPSKE